MINNKPKAEDSKTNTPTDQKMLNKYLIAEETSYKSHESVCDHEPGEVLNQKEDIEKTIEPIDQISLNDNLSKQLEEDKKAHEENIEKKDEEMKEATPDLPNDEHKLENSFEGENSQDDNESPPNDNLPSLQSDNLNVSNDDSNQHQENKKIIDNEKVGYKVVENKRLNIKKVT